MVNLRAWFRTRLAPHRLSDRLRCRLKQWMRSWKNSQITICIPSKDHVNDLLLPCLDSLERTTLGYPIDVLIGDSGSSADTIEMYHDLGLPFIQIAGPFSFARSCNHMAQAARGKELLFLNNDTMALTRDWVPRLLSNPPRGVMGALLVYPRSLRIQHAGVEVIHVKDEEDVPHGYRPPSSRFRPEDFPVMVRHLGVGQPMKHADRIDQSRCFAVTGAFLCTPKQVFSALGGFDEQYTTDLQDTDYCLKAREARLPVTCCKQIVFSHAQSASRGLYQFPEHDWHLFLSRWRVVLDVLAQGSTWDRRV